MPNLEQGQGLENNEMITSTLREGSNSKKEVIILQNKLIKLGFLEAKDDKGGDNNIGIFGPRTKEAVKNLQRKLISDGLLKPYYTNSKGKKISNIDGIFGKGTNKALGTLENKETERTQKIYEFKLGEQMLIDEQRQVGDRYKTAPPEVKKEIINTAENQEEEKLKVEQGKNWDKFIVNEEIKNNILNITIDISNSIESKSEIKIITDDYISSKYGSFYTNNFSKNYNGSISSTYGIGLKYNDGTNVDSLERNKGTEWFGYNGNKDWKTKNVDYISSFKNRKEQYKFENRFFTEQINLLDSIMNQSNSKSPLDILQAEYENASETDKIELAMVMSRFMNDIGYDIKGWKSGKMNFGDISSKNMWEAYKNGGVAGVCRQHHSEVAKFLKSVGINSGMMSLNSGEPHAVAWGKKSDGNVFIISYGEYYESKDLKDLVRIFSEAKGGLNFDEWVADENGKPIGTIQTELQKEFDRKTSILGNSDSLGHSKNISMEGINLIDGTDLGLDYNNKDKEISITQGNGNISGNINYSETEVDNATYSHLGVGVKGKVGNYNDGEASLNLGISKDRFDWKKTGKKKDYTVISAGIEGAKNLYKSENLKTNVGVGSVVQGKVSYSDGNILNFNNIDSAKGDLGTTIYVEHKFDNNTKVKGSAGVGGNIGFSSIRDTGIDKLKIFPNGEITAGLEHTLVNGDIVGSEVGYKKGTFSDKYNASLNYESGKINGEISYSEIDYNNPLFNDEKIIEAKGAYDFDKNTSFYIKGEHSDNGILEDNNVTGGFEYKF